MEYNEFLTILKYLDKNWEKPWEVEAEMLDLLNKSKKSRLVEFGKNTSTDGIWSDDLCCLW